MTELELLQKISDKVDILQGLVIGLIFVCFAIFTYCMATYIQK